MTINSLDPHAIKKTINASLGNTTTKSKIFYTQKFPHPVPGILGVNCWEFVLEVVGQYCLEGALRSKYYCMPNNKDNNKYPDFYWSLLTSWAKKFFCNVIYFGFSGGPPSTCLGNINLNVTKAMSFYLNKIR